MPRSTTDIIRHAEELANLVESDDVTLNRASPEVTRAYKQLLDAVIERGKAEEGVIQAVANLRSVGASWNLIGPALGVSRQSAGAVRTLRRGRLTQQVPASRAQLRPRRATFKVEPSPIPASGWWLIPATAMQSRRQPPDVGKRPSSTGRALPRRR